MTMGKFGDIGPQWCCG